jgi:hypothetical protein
MPLLDEESLRFKTTGLADHSPNLAGLDFLVILKECYCEGKMVIPFEE